MEDCMLDRQVNLELQMERQAAVAGVGLLLPQLTNTPKIGSVDSFAVHLVDGNAAFDDRKQISKIARVAWYSMPEYPVGYDGTVTGDAPRLYVLAENSRAVGFLLTSTVNRSWRLQWKVDGTIEFLESETRIGVFPAIGRIWIATRYQKRGLGLRLLNVTAANLEADLRLLSWELPFTVSGRILVRKTCPESFFGSCDPLTLFNLLQDQSPDAA